MQDLGGGVPGGGLEAHRAKEDAVGAVSVERAAGSTVDGPRNGETERAIVAKRGPNDHVVREAFHLEVHAQAFHLLGRSELRIEARHDDGEIELDIIVAPRDTNLEDALPHAVRGNAPPEEALPFRILASIVDDFRHQQFHGIDFVTLRISSRKA